MGPRPLCVEGVGVREAAGVQVPEDGLRADAAEDEHAACGCWERGAEG